MLKTSVRNAILAAFAKVVHYVGHRSLGWTGFLTDLLHLGIYEWIQVYKEHYPSRISDLDKIYGLVRKELTTDYCWLYGAARVKQVADQVRSALGPRRFLDGDTYLDLGCGVHNPLGLSSVIYLNGALRAFALDLSGSDSARAALALYDLLVDCVTEPDAWKWSTVDETTFRQRLARFDLKALKAGDLPKGIADVPIFHHVGDIVHPPFRDYSIDLVSSHLVLEHFLDFRAGMARLFRLTSPQGMGIHWIDLSDHRRYQDPDRFHCWSFLAEDDDWTDGRCNRLRAEEIRQICEEVGFEVLKFKCFREDMPPCFRHELRGRFKLMPDDELSTVFVLAILRRPAGADPDGN